MKAGDRYISGLSLAAIANKNIRNAAMRYVRGNLKRRSLGDRGRGCPEGVREEKYFMIRNLLNAMDKALSKDSVSFAVRRGLFESLLLTRILQ